MVVIGGREGEREREGEGGGNDGKYCESVTQGM
jgi:hypothetical protein